MEDDVSSSQGRSVSSSDFEDGKSKRNGESEPTSPSSSVKYRKKQDGSIHQARYGETDRRTLWENLPVPPVPEFQYSPSLYAPQSTASDLEFHHIGEAHGYDLLPDILTARSMLDDDGLDSQIVDEPNSQTGPTSPSSTFSHDFVVEWEGTEYLHDQFSLTEALGTISILSEGPGTIHLLDCVTYASCGHTDLLEALIHVLQILHDPTHRGYVNHQVTLTSPYNNFVTFGAGWSTFNKSRVLSLSITSEWASSITIVREMCVRLAVGLRPARNGLLWSNAMVEVNGKHTKISLLPVEPAVIHACWRPLFQNKVIARERTRFSRVNSNPNVELMLKFDTLIALSAAEFLIMVDDGLCLSGTYTLLVPVQRLGWRYLKWHLFTVDDSERKPSKARRQLWEEWTRWSQSNRWCKVKDLDELRRIPNHVLGWTKKSSITLGKSTQPYALRRSNALVKHLEPAETTFNHGINLGHGGMGMNVGQSIKFGRTEVSRIRDRDQGVIDWLAESMEEQILLYHPGRKQAWLVPKISAVHHLVLERMHYMKIRQNLPELELLFAEEDDTDAKVILALLAKNLNVPFPHWSGEGHCFRHALQSIMIALDQFERSNIRTGTQRDFVGFEAYDAIHQTPYYRLDYANTSDHPLALRRFGGWVHLLEDIPIILFYRGIDDPIVPHMNRGSSAISKRMPVDQNYLAATIMSLSELAKKYSETMFDCGQLARKAFWHCEGVFQGCDNSERDGTHTIEELQAVWTHETAAPPSPTLLQQHSQGAVIFIPGTGITEKVRAIAFS